MYILVLLTFYIRLIDMTTFKQRCVHDLLTTTSNEEARLQDFLEIMKR